MNKGLLIETHLFEAKLQQEENGTYLVKGILQRAGAPNQNNMEVKPGRKSINPTGPTKQLGRFLSLRRTLDMRPFNLTILIRVSSNNVLLKQRMRV